MGIQEKQLGQARENSTNAVSVYSPGASTTAIIKTIKLTNTSGADANYTIYIDDDGTTYDESTTTDWDITIGAGEAIQIDGWFPMSNQNGNFAYKTSVANAITITLFGLEIT